jgi:hypothetical protein
VRVAGSSAKLLRTFAERGGGQARQLFYVASQLRTTGEYPQCPVQTFGLDQATADTRRPVICNFFVWSFFMKEDVYNLYLITHGHFITQLGAKVYHIDGTDTEKSTFLKENAEKDAKNIDYFKVPSNYQAVINDEKREGLIRPEKYLQLTMIGNGIEIFSEVLESYNAPVQPFCCISHIVDGIFHKEGESKLVSNSEDYKLIRFHETEDFIEKYTHDGSFHVLELLNDDFSRQLNS